MSSTADGDGHRMHPPQSHSENGGDREYRVHDKSSQHSRSRSKDHGGRERDRSEKDRKRRDSSRERKEERDRNREREHEKRRKDKERGERRDKDRERNRHRDFDGGDQRNRSHAFDNEYESRRTKRHSPGHSSRKRERDRTRSPSHERNRKERERERSREKERSRERSSRECNSREREKDNSLVIEREREREREPPLRLDPIKEEVRESRFDLTQTIQELMNSTVSAKSFAALLNCNNSNDSFSNGQSENSLDVVAEEGVERKRRRKSRWGGTENDKTFIPGMPTILPSTLDPTQQEAYLVQLQIEEISRKLRTGDLGIPQNPEERSPSPEPIYSSDGKRLNTREFRFRKRLEEQRHQLIQKMQSVNPDFKPPADYKPPVTRVCDKVLIPQEQHPDINFVGLLIGPRGNTLKAMEKETGAKIIIRGKGSVKEGKVGRKDGQPLPGEDEPLHAFITAPNPEAVKKAVDKIKDVIRQGIEVPEGHNDLRRMQLRELAQLNGTLRETDCQRCSCGSTEHKSWLCPDKPIVTNTIVCSSCGGVGHLTKDCRNKRMGGSNDMPSEDSQAKIDEEYMSLMAELGEGPPPPSLQQQQAKQDPVAQVHMNRGYSIFDKKPNQSMQAIQQAPQLSQQHGGMSSMHVIAPPPPMPPAWGNGGGSMGIPPLIPPPPSSQPTPAAPPPLMPWMAAPQPPPPGGDSMNPPIPGAPLPPPPPGTGPMPPLIPPPPGTAAANAPLPGWSSGYGGWSAGANSYMPPPPPPPCAPPPPGLPSLAQPPPPPPPAN